MKKLLLTLTVVAASLTANAQTTKQLEGGKTQPIYEYQAVMPMTGKMELNVPFDAVTKKATPNEVASAKKNVWKAEGDAKVSALYDMPEGLFYRMPFYGDGNYFTYYLTPYAYAPARKNLVFEQYCRGDENQEVEIKWYRQNWSSADNTYVDGDEMEQDEDNNGLMSVWGFANVPKVTITQGEESASHVDMRVSSGNEYRTYMYSDTYNSSTNTENNPLFITNMRYHWDGIWSGWSGGDGWKTNFKFFDEEQKAVGFAQYYDAPQAHIYAEAVRAYMFDPNDKVDPLEFKEVTATVYTVSQDEVGNAVFNEFAKATGSFETIAHTYTDSNGGTVFMLDFPFMETDELMGDVKSPIVLPNEPLLVTITGFENIEQPLQFYFSSAEGFRGNGYGILEDGSLSSLYYSNVKTPIYDLAIGFYAQQVDIEPTNPDLVIEFPAEGGWGVTGEETDPETGEAHKYNNITFFSSVGKDDYEIVEAPEWFMEYAVGTSEENYQSRLEKGYIDFFFKGDALPEGVESREGEIILYAYGKEFPIKVHQGTSSDGIEEVTATVDLRNTPVYNLAGQRVGKDAKGVLIQNGRKIIRK